MVKSIILQHSPDIRSLPHWRLVSDQSPINATIRDLTYEGLGTPDDPFVVG